MVPATAGLGEALRGGDRRADRADQDKQGCWGVDQAPDKEPRDAQKARIHRDVLIPSACLGDDAQSPGSICDGQKLKQ